MTSSQIVKPDDRLRIGLLLGDSTVAAWSYEMIADIKRCHFAEIVLLVMIAGPPETKRKTTTSGKGDDGFYAFADSVAGRLFRLAYSRMIERHLFIPDSYEERDSSSLLKDIAVVHCQANQQIESGGFSKDAISQIKKHNISIFVNCGCEIPKGEILNSAKYGVWSIHIGDNPVGGGPAGGLVESLKNYPVTGSTLQTVTNDRHNGKVLCRSYSFTNNMSARDNHSSCLWKSLSFMTRKMKELHKKGEKEFFETVDRANRHPVFYSGPSHTALTNSDLVKITCSKMLAKAKTVFHHRFFHKQWFLMFHLSDEFSASLCKYEKIVPPKDRMWADPHVLYKDGKYYIFIEELIYPAKNAHISLIVMDENGDYQQPVRIMEKPHHLSYPFVFEHKGEFYMIPDNGSRRTVELYKCVDFPLKWQWQMNLMEDVRISDATVHYHGGKWWMFANITENRGASTWDELCLFYSDDLFSKRWRAHPRNPVVSDCRSARPAGRIFEMDGRLYRPSQNCSVRYGYGFNISHIELLDEHDYAETIVSRVTPHWDKKVIGTHTFNRANSLHVIDALARRWKW
ncbi:MAG: glucosamine inositolphosphorylceramide transferase family protein [Planctomycetota bacterium]